MKEDDDWRAERNESFGDNQKMLNDNDNNDDYKERTKNTKKENPNVALVLRLNWLCVSVRGEKLMRVSWEEMRVMEFG